jgi:U2 small nuclear ribonucleoprotein A'
MRLSIELIERSISFINALKDRELDLRSNRIPAIDNLSVTRDQYDTIDLTDNDISVLGNFPRLERLQNLYISRNNIAKIDRGLGAVLPQLSCLILAHNSIEELESLDPLSELGSTIKVLSLANNPVCKRKNYRQHIIQLLPNLKVLDFSKVTTLERQQAKQISLSRDHVEPKTSPAVLTEKERQRIAKIQTAIQQAKSLDEIQRLEHILSMGGDL